MDIIKVGFLTLFSIPSDKWAAVKLVKMPQVACPVHGLQI